MARLAVVLAAIAVTLLGCSRLNEVDANRLAEACKRAQAAGAAGDATAVRAAMNEHNRIWDEIEQRQGHFLGDGWKCGNYDVDRYIRR
jgi:hypothetical protein